MEMTECTALLDCVTDASARLLLKTLVVAVRWGNCSLCFAHVHVGLLLNLGCLLLCEIRGSPSRLYSRDKSIKQAQSLCVATKSS